MFEKWNQLAKEGKCTQCEFPLDGEEIKKNCEGEAHCWSLDCFGPGVCESSCMHCDISSSSIDNLSNLGFQKEGDMWIKEDKDVE